MSMAPGNDEDAVRPEADLQSEAGPQHQHSADQHDTDRHETERHDAEREVKAMNDELRKDVKAWSAARSGTSARAVAEFGVPAPEAPSPAKRVRKAKAVVETKPAPTVGKPFSMSYDGVTTSQHIAELLARGAR